MKFTNSGINDTIISGQRVHPSDLLEDLNEQLPLLEKALALQPEDEDLTRQLEIMYHYQSLCYKSAADNGPATEKEVLLKKAKNARQASLKYIDKLLNLNPDSERLIVPKINGIYNLSILYEEHEERLLWNREAIDLASDFLDKHPDHHPVNETLVNLQLDRAGTLLKRGQGAEEVRQLHQATYKRCLDSYKTDPTQDGLITSYISNTINNGCYLLLSGRTNDAQALFDSIDFLITEHQYGQMNWRLADITHDYFSRRSVALYQLGKYDEILDLSDAWRTNCSKYGLPPDTKIFTNSFPGQDAARFFAVFIQWLAIQRLKESSEKEHRIQLEAKEAFFRCCRNPAINVSELIGTIGTKLPIENLKQWQLEAIESSRRDDIEKSQ